MKRSTTGAVGRKIAVLMLAVFVMTGSSCSVLPQEGGGTPATEGIEPTGATGATGLPSNAAQSDLPPGSASVPHVSWLSINAPMSDETWGEQYLETTFGVEIELVKIYNPNWREKVDLLLAGGDIPDFMRLDGIDTLRAYHGKGYLADIPVDDIRTYMPEYSRIAEAADPQILNYATVDGTGMGIPILYTSGQYPIPAAIRADWLEAVGETEVPATLDDLERVFHAFRYNDPDRDGVQDTQAMSMGNDCPRAYRFQSIFGAYGVNPYQWRVSDAGELEFGFTTRDFEQALIRLQGWVREGLIAPSFATDDYRTGVNDIAQAFASGQTGYIDSYTFDDHHWDNDGNLNAAWVRNQPAWQVFFEENQGDSDVLYGTDNFFSMADIAADLPEPVYITLPPVTGPDGRSGYVRDGVSSTYAAIGRQTGQDRAKYEKILGMLETLATDEQVYLYAHFGPEGKAWITQPDGTRVFNPKWAEDPDYHPQWLKTGTGYWANPMYLSNPAFLTALGGARTEQRYRLGDRIAQWPVLENALKVGLSDTGDAGGLTTQMVDDFMLEALMTDMDIAAVFPQRIALWMEKGGYELTQAANEWANGLQAP